MPTWSGGPEGAPTRHWPTGNPKLGNPLFFPHLANVNRVPAIGHGGANCGVQQNGRASAGWTAGRRRMLRPGDFSSDAVARALAPTRGLVVRIPTSKTPPPKPHLQNPISKPQFRAAVQSRTWVCASPPRLGGLSRQQPAAGSGHVGDSKTLSANSRTAARSGSGPEPFAAVWGEDGARITPRALPRLRGRGSLPQPRQREHCGPPSPCRESLRECGGFP